MTAVQIVFSVIYFIAALILVAIVMLQSGKSSGLGAIGGNSGSETFLAKNKSKSLDAKLAKATTWVAIGFMVLTLIICFL